MGHTRGNARALAEGVRVPVDICQPKGDVEECHVAIKGLAETVQHPGAIGDAARRKTEDVCVCACGGGR